MKRINKILCKGIFLIFVIALSNITVNAEKCVAVSGDGKNVGDEVACGSEHFYVMSNDGTNIKMLAKYNLKTNLNMYNLNVNGYESTSYNGYYQIDLVQQLLKEGWDVYHVDYEYEYDEDNDNDKYIFNNVIFLDYYKNDNIDNKVIFFDNDLSLYDIYQNDEIKKYLNDGYNLEETFDSDSGVGFSGVRLIKYKDNSTQYKNIYLDETQLTFNELYNKNEIKSLVDDGWYILDWNYNGYTKLSDSNSYYKLGFYIVTLAKSENYDKVLLLSDKEYNNWTDFWNYMENTEEYLNYENNGYYCNGYNSYYIGNKGYYNGVICYFSSKEFYDGLQDVDSYKNYYTDDNGSWQRNSVGIPFSIFDFNYYPDHDEYFDMSLVDDNILLDYKKSLNNAGYNINDIDIISAGELITLVNNLTGGNISIDEFYNEFFNIAHSNFLGEMSLNIRDYFSDDSLQKYSWLWNTAYFTKTFGSAYHTHSIGFTYFDILGNLYIGSEPSGIRPVVTIKADEIIVVTDVEEINNPETKDMKIVILFLLVVGGVIALVYNYRKLNWLR